MGDAAVRQVLGSDALVGLLEMLMGDQVVAFDHKWFRFVLPGGQTPFHMDSVFFGRSRRAGPLDAAGLHTVWLPWNDLPPEAGGLLLLEGLDELLPDSHRLLAVRGELARRDGDTELAFESLRSAIERCDNDVERAHLERKLQELGSGTTRGGPSAGCDSRVSEQKN